MMQEYFFPKEDAAAKQRQQQWVQSVASRRKSTLAHGESNSSGNRCCHFLRIQLPRNGYVVVKAALRALTACLTKGS